MIGSRMRENCTYGLTRGDWTFIYGQPQTGTQLETADTAKG
jgi:hypothetical protein